MKPPTAPQPKPSTESRIPVRPKTRNSIAVFSNHMHIWDDRRLFDLDTGRRDDRSPFFELGFLKYGQRLGRLLFRGINFLSGSQHLPQYPTAPPCGPAARSCAARDRRQTASWPAARDR